MKVDYSIFCMQVELDFKSLYPEETSNFVMKWPTMKGRVIEVARRIRGNDTITSLLSMVQGEETNEADPEEEEESSLPANDNGRD